MNYSVEWFSSFEGPQGFMGTFNNICGKHPALIDSRYNYSKLQEKSHGLLYQQQSNLFTLCSYKEGVKHGLSANLMKSMSNITLLKNVQFFVDGKMLYETATI